MMPLLPLAQAVVHRARETGTLLVTAESCTGGLVSSLLTEIPGSSAVFDCGFVTYSNEAKQQLLFVPVSELMEFGAVSAEVAESMIRGALSHSRAHIAISLTGIAGPDGGTAEKPVGLVWLGFGRKFGTISSQRLMLSGDRHSIRTQATEAALKQFLAMMT